MQKHMGGDVTVSALRWQFAAPIRADAKRLQEARAAGIDCQTIVLTGPGGSFKGGAKSQISFIYVLSCFCIAHLEPRTPIDIIIEIQRNFGSDSTAGALRIAMFREVTPKVKLIRATVAAGGDPKDLNLAGADVKDLNIAGEITGKGRSFVFSFLCTEDSSQLPHKTTEKQLLIFQISPSILGRIPHLGESSSSFAL